MTELSSHEGSITSLAISSPFNGGAIVCKINAPRGGSMVNAISGSTQREPLVVGKPSTFMMDYLANSFIEYGISNISLVDFINHRFGILKSQICMVGDRLDTDILFGQNGGCKTLLVLSGVTALSMLQNPNNSSQPDFYTNKISDFLALKAAAV
ncbi:HAD hydrolase-like protein [Fagus crenata]